MDKFREKMERKLAKEFKHVTKTMLSHNNTLDENAGGGQDFRNNLMDLMDRKVDKL